MTSENTPTELQRSSQMNGNAMEEPSQKKPRQQTELELFDAVFPEIVDFLVDPSQSVEDAELCSAYSWFRKVLEYNVPHGKKNRGLFVVTAYRLLYQNPADEDLHTARMLGWCIEMLQAFFLVADDVMDHSYTRRGKPCWYKQDGVGMEAINDGVYMEACIYKMLKKYIRNKPYYLEVMELFHEITMNTIHGQCLDMTVSPPEGCVDFTKYTMDKYLAIVKWKTAFYSFYLPVALAMYMAGISDEKSHTHAKSILLKMGEYFQAQDDYLDSYGDPEVIGKIGTDIEDNKCSWLVVTALRLATPEQIQILRENYGRKNPDNVAAVKSLYKELKLEHAFSEFEESSYQEILTLANSSNGSLPKDLFIAFANKIYKRHK